MLLKRISWKKDEGPENGPQGLQVAQDLGVSLTWNECNLSIFPYADEI